jgi:hypothetical protein
MADQVEDILREKPEYRTIDFAGEEREFMLGDYALRKAKENGVDGFAALQDVMPEEGEQPRMDIGIITSITDLVYTGMLPFKETAMDHEMVSVHMSMAEAVRLQETVMEGMPGQEEASEGSEANEGSEAKK